MDNGVSKSIVLEPTIKHLMKYVVQPKTTPFSTHDLIWANYQVVSKLSQLILLSFSYLSIAQHN